MAQVVDEVRDQEGTEVGPEVLAQTVAAATSADEGKGPAVADAVALLSEAWAAGGVRDQEGREALLEAAAATAAAAEAEVRSMAPPQLLRTWLHRGHRPCLPAEPSQRAAIQSQAVWRGP